MTDTTKPCGCTDDVPCLKHASVWADRLMNSPEFLAWDLAQVKSDLDLAGPEDDEPCLPYVGELQSDEDRAWGHEHLTGWER